MRYMEKHPMIMILVGVVGISLSSIFVKYSAAPSAVTAAWRLLWTVILLTPAVIGKASVRREMGAVSPKLAILSCLSGVFLAAHFALWFESLQHTTVASSTTIVCTEVIWVSLGYCLFQNTGEAYSSYVYPERVNGDRGRFFDPFANEQDGFLYLAYKLDEEL